MSESHPPVLLTVIRMKCPKCGKGDVFKNKSVFPLGECLRMNEYCSHCKRRLVYESNNGPGFNYVLTVMVFFLNLLWYWPIFGISYMDNSIFYYMITSIIVVVLLQPWLMRISRIIYLHIFWKFREE